MHEELRSLPLLGVLVSLGFVNWKSRKGDTEWYGTCPIHKAKNNATSFSFDSEKFHCFSCGAKGRGAIDLVKAVNQVGFQEAVTWLKGVSIVPIQQTPNQEKQLETSTENAPYKSSYEKFKVESAWLRERGLTQETCDHYGVFEYNNPARKSAYSGRIMLPVLRFRDGEGVGYLARATQAEPKYLFPKGVQKSLELFGAWQIQQSGQQLPLRVGYLVESPFCVMKFHQLGFPAVSPYGWSVSDQQVTILGQLAKGWIYLADSDKRSSIPQYVSLIAERCWIKCPPFPATDPEQLTAEQLRAL